MKMNERTRVAFRKWFEWYYETHVRTPERNAMLFNSKTHEIFEDMVADEIIRRVAKECEETNGNPNPRRYRPPE